MIKFSCEHCGKDNITAPDTAAGKRGKCPACKQVVSIPTLDDVETDLDIVEEPETSAPPRKPVPARPPAAPSKPRPAAPPRQPAMEDDDDVVSADDVVDERKMMLRLEMGGAHFFKFALVGEFLL